MAGQHPAILLVHIGSSLQHSAALAPPFVSAYDLTDRCHLNGMALRNGQPTFATALGATDRSEGWRANKARGGVLLEAPSGRVIAAGLSMPHSPRWHQDKLWYLESGAGQLKQIDPASNQPTLVAEFPGFTRGLDFIDRYAFVGLSQVRETAVFSGLPLTTRVSERHCGIWVVDTITRQIVAYVVFTGSVQEIFAVQVLPWRFPALLDIGDPLVRSSYALPDEAIKDVAPADPLYIQLEQATHIHRQGDFATAITRYQELLKIHPDHLPLHYQLGLALVDAERWDEAELELNWVIARQPKHAEAHNSLGVSHLEREHYDQALQHFEQAIAADRQYAIAHFNRGLALLKLGDYLPGWREYEWRWQMSSFTPFQCPQPLWTGEAISEKVLLVHTEQGHGDAIQFARFLPLAARRCKKLMVACTEPLRTLFASIDGVSEIRLAGALPQDCFDLYCPLLSLPKALGITLESLPAQVPYLTVPAHVTVPPLPAHDHLKVGIVWAGSPTYQKNHCRSCSLESFQALFELSRIAFYSLQTPLSTADARTLDTGGVIDLGKELTDYARTAAYMQQLDLVLSVDTSVAHLAGALGRPVWVLLPYNADWRWLRKRDDSPWYPTARLFRQSNPGDWEELMQRVRSALQSLRAHFR